MLAMSPLEIGKDYLVPCARIRKKHVIKREESVVCEAGVSLVKSEKEVEIVCHVPIIDHLHSDRENGQPYRHYHIDDRFYLPELIDCDILISYDETRISECEFESIEYIKMKCGKLHPSFVTDPEHIRNSRLKHKCVRNGKCPHRGYDLTKEHPDADGVVTCPLHGLKFKDGDLITEF